ncbi:MAG: class III cytochrome C family protein [Nevskia sp.]|jgi:hypothetical protein|nr:class III cytochrome C family protein [Nevskia sp.]
MKGPGLWRAVIAVLVSVLVLVFVFPEPMISPGGMLKGHQFLSKNCFACHTPLLGSRSEKCVSCHAVARIGLFTTTGQPISGKDVSVPFHQQLTEQTCTTCHAEHAGPDAALAMHPFSHTLLQAEVRTQCASCHIKPQNALHRQLTSGCQQCHSTEKWRPATFDHAQRFVLDGDHNVACATCHVANDFSRYTCYGCHEHSPAGIRAKHEREGIRDFANCVECHRSAEEGGEGDEHHGNARD